MLRIAINKDDGVGSVYLNLGSERSDIINFAFESYILLNLIKITSGLYGFFCIIYRDR